MTHDTANERSQPDVAQSDGFRRDQSRLVHTLRMSDSTIESWIDVGASAETTDPKGAWWRALLGGAVPRPASSLCKTLSDCGPVLRVWRIRARGETPLFGVRVSDGRRVDRRRRRGGDCRLCVEPRDPYPSNGVRRVTRRFSIPRPRGGRLGRLRTRNRRS